MPDHTQRTRAGVAPETTPVAETAGAAIEDYWPVSRTAATASSSTNVAAPARAEPARPATPVTTPAAVEPAAAPPVQGGPKPLSAVIAEIEAEASAKASPKARAKSAAPATTGASTTTPGGEPKPNPTVGVNPRWMIAAGVGALVVVAGVIALLAWKPWRTNAPPRITAPANALSSYVRQDEFLKLPFDRQFSYLKQMDDKEDDLVNAYRAGRMTADDLSGSLEAAYLGRWLGRMKNYYERPTAKDREAYLDKLLDRKDAEKRGTPRLKKDGTREVATPDAKDADDVKNVRRDEAMEAKIIPTWPADVQKQWFEFHQAFRDRKQARRDREAQELRELREKAATSTTKPGK